MLEQNKINDSKKWVVIHLPLKKEESKARGIYLIKSPLTPLYQRG
jgi:hypothetical protein